jgi:hypothetical protein
VGNYPSFTHSFGRLNRERELRKTEVEVFRISNLRLSKVATANCENGLTVEDMTLKGQAATKSEAIAEAERAIDRSVSRRNLKGCPT